MSAVGVQNFEPVHILNPYKNILNPNKREMHHHHMLWFKMGFKILNPYLLTFGWFNTIQFNG